MDQNHSSPVILPVQTITCGFMKSSYGFILLSLSFFCIDVCINRSYKVKKCLRTGSVAAKLHTLTPGILACSFSLPHFYLLTIGLDRISVSVKAEAQSAAGNIKSDTLPHLLH